MMYRVRVCCIRYFYISMNAYEEAVQYIETIPSFTRKHTVALVREYLRSAGLLSLWEDKPFVIHVAGTNGKGSTCNYIAQILREQGYHTGVFTSPHLITPRERMTFDGEMISEAAFAECFEKTRKLCERWKQLHPSYFEFLFLLGLFWFQERRPEFFIVEAGMGGLQDATNALPVTDLSVITSISEDHQQFLGKTIGKIAAQKAGILREGGACVFSAEKSQAFSVIMQEAKRKNCAVFRVFPEDIQARRDFSGGIDFSYTCRYHGNGQRESSQNGNIPAEFPASENGHRNGNQPFAVRAKLRTEALYQAQNAALAVVACRAVQELSGGRYRINPESITRGLSDGQLPCRMEQILPGLTLDGANNRDGIRQLLRSLSAAAEDEAGRSGSYIVFSAMKDKDYRGELKDILRSPAVKGVLLCPMEGSRALPPGELLTAAKEAALESGRPSQLRLTAGMEDAAAQVLRLLHEHEQVVVTGSLYLAGSFRKYIKEHYRDQF